MASFLVINATPEETRVALIEGGFVTEVHIERQRDRGLVGNIYKGKVIRVLPGMQAAFVDIGLERAAFLYVADVHQNMEELELLFDEGEEELGSLPGHPHRGQSIETLLKEGQEVVVQVAKEPLGTKGARVTSRVALAGRHLVLMPTVDHVGVSRRITNNDERQRLKAVIDEARPKGSGFIVRTACEKEPTEKIKQDVQFLVALWNDIIKKAEHTQAPQVLYNDLDLPQRAVRDLSMPDLERVVVDDKDTYQRIKAFTKAFMPQFADKVVHYQNTEPIFEAYGIEMEINKALGRKVWLKSGGYIVIDQTEALTAVDVNTGRYVGRHNLQETILKTNLEAVREVVYQLRLRNIGGLVIIDFIDMENPHHRERVYHTLDEALRQDRARTNVLRISELGLVEMTRQRIRACLERTLCEPCFYCDGRGYLKSKVTVCYEIFRQIRLEGMATTKETFVVSAHPDVAHMLCDEEQASLARLEKDLKRKIIIKAKPGHHIEQFEITPQ